MCCSLEAANFISEVHGYWKLTYSSTHRLSNHFFDAITRVPARFLFLSGCSQAASTSSAPVIDRSVPGTYSQSLLRIGRLADYMSSQ
jgi:hypothetical protein